MAEHGPRVTNAEQIVRTLEASGLDLDRCVVWGGSALAMHGVRSASDVDLVVEPALFDELLSERETPVGIALSPERTVSFDGRLVGQGQDNDLLKLDIVNLPGNDKDSWFFEYMERAETIESKIGSISVASLDACYALIRGSWRPKYWRDIRRIKAHQKSMLA